MLLKTKDDAFKETSLKDAIEKTLLKDDSTNTSLKDSFTLSKDAFTNLSIYLQRLYLNLT